MRADMAKGWGGRFAAPALGFLLLPVLLTWPLATRIGDRFAGNERLDIWLFAWNLWWMRHALTALHTNPFMTQHLFYPGGAELYLHTFVPLPGVLAIPAGALWGFVAAYNLSALLALGVAGWATYWLARRWTSPAGAALAGFAFAAAPWLLHQLRIGHLNLMSAGWLVLALPPLARAVHTYHWRDCLLAALGIVVATLVDWQFALFLAVIGLVIAAERLLTARAWATAARRLGALTLIGGLAAGMLLPYLVPTARQSATVPAEDVAKFEREQLEYSADLLAFVLPQQLHPLWGAEMTAALRERPLGSYTEGQVSLGLSALLLAGLALAARRPGAALWGAIALVGFVLALGPRLHVGGQDTGIPLPYALLAELPLVNFGRTPARFAVVTSLAVAVLAGIGLPVAAGAARQRWGARMGQVTTVTLAALLVFEFLPIPYPTIAVPPLGFAERVAEVAGDGVVLELPYRVDDTRRMLFQIVHERPIFEGYTARQPDHPFLERTPVIADLMWPSEGPDIVPPVREEPLGVLATYRVTAIAVYPPPYTAARPDAGVTPSAAELRRRVEDTLGVTGPVWEDETGALYRVPPAAPVPVLALADDGWHAPESWSGGWMRWMMASARLRLDRVEPRDQMLRFTAWSFHRPRTLEVLADGQSLARVALTPDPRPVELTLPARAGSTHLTLRVVEGAETPASLGLGPDPRPLSIAIADLQLRDT